MIVMDGVVGVVGMASEICLIRTTSMIISIYGYYGPVLLIMTIILVFLSLAWVL